MVIGRWTSVEVGVQPSEANVTRELETSVPLWAGLHLNIWRGREILVSGKQEDELLELMPGKMDFPSLSIRILNSIRCGILGLDLFTNPSFSPMKSWNQTNPGQGD